MNELSVIKVLIVDDHFLTRQIVADVMRENGVSDVVMVTDGMAAREALEAAHARGEPFNILFLDWEMPRLNGVDLLTHMRLREEFDDVAIIMLTAVAEQNNVMKAIRAGANSYLVKPITKKSIGKKFKEMIAWREKRNAV